MANGFLQAVTKHIYKSYRDQFPELCLVFPNRRAILFFKKYLEEITDRPVLMPESFTINELFSRISGLYVPETIPLVFELYTVYSRVAENPEPFDEFINWGEILLQDYDDVDKYMANAGQLFKNVADLKEIDQWFDFPDEEQRKILALFWNNINTSKDSQEKINFLKFWNLLLPLYTEFRKALLSKGMAYEGLNCRIVAESLESANIPWRHCCIIGFNALTACEKELFRHLSQEGQASFYWDYDVLYTEDPLHEAGFFMRNNIRQFPPPADFITEKHFREQDRHIRIIGVPSLAGQSAWAGELVNRYIKAGSEPVDTAIVLADEHQLVPVLQTLPESCGKFNITLGFPVNESSVYGLVNQWLDLQKNRRTVHGEPCYYYRNVLSLLHHPLLFGEEDKAHTNLIDRLYQERRTTVPVSLLTESETGRIVFLPVSAPDTLLSRLMELLLCTYRHLHKQQGDHQNILTLEKEVIYKIYVIWQRLLDTLKAAPTPLSEETIIKIVRRVLQNIRVPLTGEPLQGLQILGLLETRNLDFSHIILFPANEGVLPKVSPAPSLIPQNLRYAFQMPTIEHQDAIFSYYFYRLLHQAKEMTILWDSSSKEPLGGKMSRYLYQLIYEKPVPVEIINPVSVIRTTPSIPLSIEKTADIISQIIQPDNKGNRYLSPSSFTSYLRCPLQYYFRYVARIKPVEDLTEEADPKIFGTLFHDAIQYVLTPFAGKGMVSASQLEISDDVLEKAVEEALRKEVYPHVPPGTPIEPEGQYVIIHDVLIAYLKKCIELDRQNCPFELLELEKEYTMKFSFRSSGQTHSVMLGGRIDRLQRQGPRLQIIDYKTGKKEPWFPGITALFHSGTAKRNNEAFQACFYSLLLHQKFSETLIEPDLYHLREMFKVPWEPTLVLGEGHQKNRMEDFRPYVSEFKENLEQLLSEITDLSVPFSQTPHTVFCTRCDFSAICRKS